MKEVIQRVLDATVNQEEAPDLEDYMDNLKEAFPDLTFTYINSPDGYTKIVVL